MKKNITRRLMTALLAAVMCVSMAVQLGGVILGAVIYYIVYQVIIFAGFDTDLLKMFSAVVVAVFLGAPHVKAQLKAHSRSKKGDSGHAENG
jgi:putative ABC transport system permease protein